MQSNLISTNQNAKQVLARAKNLQNITKKILTKEDIWMKILWKWADENEILDYEWVEDGDFDEGGYHNGIPRTKKSLLNLKILRLHDVDIKELPKEFFNLTQLKELKIKNTNLKVLSSEVKKLKNLEELYLAKNQLSTLPNELQYLTKLTEIHLHSNNFDNFPEILYKIKSLKHICLDTNHPSQLSSKISNLENLTELDYKNISTIPKEISSLNFIKFKLHVNSDGIFPSGIEYLSNLEKLTIIGNNKAELPKEIFKFKNLTTLNFVDFNKIDIPNNNLKLKKIMINIRDEIANLGRLSYLEELIIFESDIEVLPDDIVQLNDLKKLVLSDLKNIEFSAEQLRWFIRLDEKNCKLDIDPEILKKILDKLDNDDDEIL